MKTKILYFQFFLFTWCIFLLLACTKEITPRSKACDKEYTQVNTQHLLAKEYQSALDHFRMSNTIPGAVLLVQDPVHGLWIGTSGYANLEHRVTLQACDQFRVASTTKTLIGTVVLQLAEEDKLGLDSKLSDLLPEVNSKIPYANEITIRHLLNHTSGIHDYQEDLNYRLDMFNNPKMATARSSQGLLESYVHGKPADFKPGKRWRYSNSNFNLLELIIENLESKTTQQVLAERLFVPLGMEGYFEVRPDAHLVQGYRDLYENGTLVSTTYWDPTDDGQGDGGYIGTAYDLFLFNQALMNGKLVNQQTLASMKTLDVPGSDYGLALQQWQIGATYAWGHAGQAYGFQSWMLYFPQEQVQVVLLVNLSNRPAKESFEELIEHILP